MKTTRFRIRRIRSYWHPSAYGQLTYKWCVWCQDCRYGNAYDTFDKAINTSFIRMHKHRSKK